MRHGHREPAQLPDCSSLLPPRRASGEPGCAEQAIAEQPTLNWAFETDLPRNRTAIKNEPDRRSPAPRNANAGSKPASGLLLFIFAARQYDPA